MSRRLMDHIEVLLSFVGLVLIFVLPQFLSPFFKDIWAVTAITATTVGILHGFIFWIIRGRQRTVRGRTIAELQEMLNDVATNQLALIQVNTMLAKPASEKHVERVINAVKALQSALTAISEESLHQWQNKYEEARQSAPAGISGP